MSITNSLIRLSSYAAGVSLLLASVMPSAMSAENRSVADELAAAAGVHGGLCVQVGGDGSALAVPLAETGRFLVHALYPAEETVKKARADLSTRELYGLASVDVLGADGRLPYTGDLLNLLLIPNAPAVPVSLDEVNRVLCPDGVILAAPDAFSAAELEAAGLYDVRTVQANGAWMAARKPRPTEMDGWTHPRHSASGNPVSNDTMVAPPRRVRWVVGALAEVPGIVTSAGRNYYGAALARDSFNGLRLWSRDLVTPSATGPFVMKRLPPVIPPPIAVGSQLYVVSSNKLMALDAATGEPVREYPDAGQPRLLLHDDGVLIVADAGTVRALDAASARLLWRYETSDPRYVVAGDGYVGVIQGRSQRGEQCTLVALDKTSGVLRWKRDNFPWAEKVRQCVYYRDMLAYEVSSFNDNAPGNSLHVLSAIDGKLIWEREFLPGMNHTRQARAMFVGDRLWILHGGKDAEGNRFPIECSALDPRTGETQVTYPAGLTHCFPPVATSRYMFAGELDMTDLMTGQKDANRITKAACSRDHGWVPANGLIYVTPKHCVCWPMLRGYAALAPERPEGDVAAEKLEDIEFVLEKGVDPPAAGSAADDAGSWPCYRHDAWRSASTTTPGPNTLETIWSADLGGWPDGPITADWRENPFVKGPITSPVVAGGLAYVARPDAHQVVAMDASTGEVRWRFRATGRVDTAPTIHGGLCLFGAKSGWVYCVRADDGRMVWRLRAAPLDERIVAYGQLESPWPVPGSVLVVDNTAYFAAGRQPFADGGILMFAVDPADGSIRWVKRHNTVPQRGFYECSALELDNFDLLHRQGAGVAMSRWVFDRATGDMSIQHWDAFAKLNTGGGAAMVPQGCWSYAPRHQARTQSFTHRRPLVVFRDNRLWGAMQGMQSVYRRDFDLDGGETFDAHWITGWAAGQLARDGKTAWRSQRLAEKAKWQVDAFDAQAGGQTIAAMVLASDRLWIAGSKGELRILSTEDGNLLAKHNLPAPLWDGMAIANGRLFVSTADGKLLCLGGK
ncbi:MAG: PQQ-binding-like beta-propeller repeat protein [Pirellulaceae bacterium]|nr:PQQ-binding-like beta-propeller repeat protein [Pirellulaceae bacterium]